MTSPTGHLMPRSNFKKEGFLIFWVINLQTSLHLDFCSFTASVASDFAADSHMTLT